MSDPTPSYLRLHVAEEIRDQKRTADDLPSLIAALREPFAEVTGCLIDFRAGQPSQSDLPTTIALRGAEGASDCGYLSIAPDAAKAAAGGTACLPAAVRLGTALAELASRLVVCQDALWKREAELAAGVPVTLQSESEAHLAVRLQSVLHSAVDAAGCQAAGLYLLDADTSELKLRSCWGLPHERLTAPARPLRGAVADLEALLGHAVVLDDPERFPYWNAPENFAAAVCVPVSTPTVPLGTLWVFADCARDFSAHETGMLELAAGRIAADLEREMLLTEGLEGHRLKRQLSGAERLQRSQLPRIAPLVDGWEVAGWCEQRDPLGGDFFDWFPLGRGPTWGVALGDALHAGVEGALVAATVRAALRAHALGENDPGRLLAMINRTLWTSSAGDQSAALGCLVIEPECGHVRCSAAGSLTVAVIRRDGSWQTLTRPTLPLGREPSESYASIAVEIFPEDIVLAYSDGFREVRDGDGVTLAEAALAEALYPYRAAGADQIGDAVRAAFDRHAQAHDDRSVVVLKRRQQRGQDSLFSS